MVSCRPSATKPESRSGGACPWLVAALIAGVALTNPTRVAAQEFDSDAPLDTAGNRPQIDYDPTGLLIGDIHVYPALSLTGTYDDNVFARDFDPQDDFTLTLVPSVRAELSPPGWRVGLSGSARIRRYAELTGQDDEQFQLQLGGSSELSNSTSLATEIGWSQSTVDRGSFENGLQVGEPLREQRLRGLTTLRHRFNRLSLKGSLSFDDFSYSDVELDDGTVIDQTFRNGMRIGGDLEAGYEIGARLSIVAQGAVDQYDFDDRGQLVARDAVGYRVSAGVRYELTRLLVLEIAPGFRTYDFEDPALGDISGFAPRATLRWYPTRLLSLRFDVSNSATTSAYDSVAAVVVTTGRLSADYELLRNLILSTSVGASFESYGKVNGTSRLYSFETGAVWKANRFLRLNGQLNYAKRASSTGAIVPEFNILRVMLTATIAR